MRKSKKIIVVSIGAALVSLTTLNAQSVAPGAGAPVQPLRPSAVGAAAGAVTAPPDYVIGIEDVLTIFFWREQALSGDVVVRPDGKITLPLLNELVAAGLTPTELRENVTKAAAKYFPDEPIVTVGVKQINSRKVYITGEVAKGGTYPLLESTTVLQLIIKAGGLTEFADRKHITVVRAEKRPDGKNWTSAFNYDDMMNRRNLKQNIELKPGDVVMVK